jgi:hypothetical protein
MLCTCHNHKIFANHAWTFNNVKAIFNHANTRNIPIKSLYKPRVAHYNAPSFWGYSSAGRALAWHARGQRFDPAYLHQERVPIV